LITDPKQRFNGHAEYYAKYRPSYPHSVLEYMERQLGFSAKSLVADVGSGTGIFAEMLAQNGNRVFGVEPNDEMRNIAEENLSSNRNFTSIKGSAEATTLPTVSVDFITAAQSFHWFDHAKARQEFRRILREKGWVILLWNTRRTDTPFLQAYDRIIRGNSVETRGIKHEDITEELLSAFLGKYRSVKLSYIQECDEVALKGRVLSASYAPLPGDPAYVRLDESLRGLFRRYQMDGRVRFEYLTELYAGQLG
jgi:SAM-dependent methyltransferase